MKEEKGLDAHFSENTGRMTDSCLTVVLLLFVFRRRGREGREGREGHDMVLCSVVEAIEGD